MIAYLIIYAVIGFVLNTIWIYKDRKIIFTSPAYIGDVIYILSLYIFGVSFWPIALCTYITEYLIKIMKKQLW